MLMDKKEWRGTIMTRLKGLSEQEKQFKSKAIYQHLLHLSTWETSLTIGVTISTTKEINTRPIIEKAWEWEKQVAVPKCLPQTKQLDFRKLDNFSQLESVYFGLQEPIVAETSPIQPEHMALLIVPGLCFDSRGYRIGFGGGYYDRFLENYQGITVALAYEEQLIEKLPEEAHDIPVDFLVTPKGVVTCSKTKVTGQG
jgi:5-formyltetrahydrofolate cyclo-ligase